MRIRQPVRHNDEPDTGHAGTPRDTTTAAASPERRSHQRHRPAWRRLFTWRKLLVTLVFLCALPVGVFTVLYLTIDIPRPNHQAKVENNVYLFSDGSRLTSTGDVNRESVPLDRIPKKVQRAFLGAENTGFYDDPGISVTGLIRGTISTLTGQGTQGGSTITQQYVKNYYLSQEQTVTRKVKELIISLKVDEQGTKDEILAGYLNSSYYGRQAYGVQAAARAYYHRDASDLTVEQGAYLAALLQAPSRYDWATAEPEDRRRVTARWKYVLNNMVEQGWLSRDERARMQFPEPADPHPASQLAGQNGYLVDAARQELMASGISEQELAAGGWRITLSIDRDRQRALKKAIATSFADSPDKKSDSQEAAGSDRQAGAVSIDPRTGRILALYGGRDYLTHYRNNATRSDYQAGPTLWPLPFLAQGTGDGAAPERSGPGRDVKRPAATATARQLRRTATALGITSHAEDLTSAKKTFLGLVGASPMEIAGAYASLEHDGKRVTPSIVRSASRAGEHRSLREAVGDQAVDSALAARHSARRAVTGPSDDGKAEWYVGSSAELVTSIALFGADDTTREQVPLNTRREDATTKIFRDYAGRAAGPGKNSPAPAKG